MMIMVEMVITIIVLAALWYILSVFYAIWSIGCLCGVSLYRWLILTIVKLFNKFCLINPVWFPLFGFSFIFMGVVLWVFYFLGIHLGYALQFIFWIFCIQALLIHYFLDPYITSRFLIEVAAQNSGEYLPELGIRRKSNVTLLVKPNPLVSLWRRIWRNCLRWVPTPSTVQLVYASALIPWALVLFTFYAILDSISTSIDLQGTPASLTMRDGTDNPEISIYPEDCELFRQFYYDTLQKEILSCKGIVKFLKEFIHRKFLSGSLFPLNDFPDNRLITFESFLNYLRMAEKYIYVPKEFFLIKDSSDLKILLKFVGELTYEEFIKIVERNADNILIIKLDSRGFYNGSTNLISVLMQPGLSLHSILSILYIYADFYWFYNDYYSIEYDNLCYIQGIKALGECFEYSDRYNSDTPLDGSPWIGKNYIFESPYILRYESISLYHEVILFIFKNSRFYSESGYNTLKAVYTKVSYYDIFNNEYVTSCKEDTSEYEAFDLRAHPNIGEYYTPVIKYVDYYTEYIKKNPELFNSKSRESISEILQLNRKIKFIKHAEEMANAESFLLEWSGTNPCETSLNTADMVDVSALEPY